MKTPECTEAKIGTVDNVHKICIQTKFDNWTYCYSTHDTVHASESN